MDVSLNASSTTTVTTMLIDATTRRKMVVRRQLGNLFYTLASNPKISSKVLRKVLLLHL